jgi:hypothetical protein
MANLSETNVTFMVEPASHHRSVVMAADETELEMAVRHVAEQEARVARQEALIERLRKLDAPLDNAPRLLDTMEELLQSMRAHVARLSK